MLKFVFVVGLARFVLPRFGDRYVKTIEGTPIPRMFDMGSGVWQYKVACTEMFAGVRAS